MISNSFTSSSLGTAAAVDVRRAAKAGLRALLCGAPPGVFFGENYSKTESDSMAQLTAVVCR